MRNRVERTCLQKFKGQHKKLLGVKGDKILKFKC